MAHEKRARDEKLRELKLTDPNATLRALDPGPRTTNKCIGVLISIGFYAVDHDLAIKNVAQRMEKVLEDGEGEDEDSEESVIEENVLTPSELVRAIERRWIRIRRTQRGAVFSKPKSKASRRTIELPAPLIEELKRWRPLCPKNEHDVALGHANVYITLKTYAHAIPKPRHGVSDRMAALMKETNQRGYKMGTEGVEDHCASLERGGVTH